MIRLLLGCKHIAYPHTYNWTLKYPSAIPLMHYSISSKILSFRSTAMLEVESFLYKRVLYPWITDVDFQLHLNGQPWKNVGALEAVLHPMERMTGLDRLWRSWTSCFDSIMKPSLLCCFRDFPTWALVNLPSCGPVAGIQVCTLTNRQTRYFTNSCCRLNSSIHMSLAKHLSSTALLCN